MRKADFQFELPRELIAQHPLAERSASRLLVVDACENENKSDSIKHKTIRELPELLQAGDLLVFNNTRVLPARMWGKKSSGGRVEILIERLLNANTALAHLRVSKKPQMNALIEIEGGGRLRYLNRSAGLFLVESLDESMISLMQRSGHMPLPPYIERIDTIEDQERYQTVFSSKIGAVAAPTAGLHFDQFLLDAVHARGIRTAEITLHVGAGTFQPLRVDDLSQHQMHHEWIEVEKSVCEAVLQTKANGGRVIAIGTTVTRALESAALANAGALKPFQGETDIFIKPGFQFKVIDAQFTNFHLPESTLLILVSAFGGYSLIRRAYQEAIQQKYRFFSYGDAMLIWPPNRTRNEI